MTDENRWPTITITVDDPVTGTTTTITGTAKVSITTVAPIRDPEPQPELQGLLSMRDYGPPSLRLVAEWKAQDDGERYTVSRVPAPSPSRPSLDRSTR